MKENIEARVRREIADDQTLPPNRYKAPMPGRNAEFDAYREAQSDMFYAGWRKVKFQAQLTANKEVIHERKDKQAIEKIASFILPIKEGKTWITWDIALDIARDIYEAHHLPEQTDREAVELCMLNFATDYHNFEDIREDIVVKGIKSHPYHVDKLLSRIQPELKVECDAKNVKHCPILEKLMLRFPEIKLELYLDTISPSPTSCRRRRKDETRK